MEEHLYERLKGLKIRGNKFQSLALYSALMSEAILPKTSTAVRNCIDTKGDTQGGFKI